MSTSHVARKGLSGSKVMVIRLFSFEVACWAPPSAPLATIFEARRPAENEPARLSRSFVEPVFRVLRPSCSLRKWLSCSRRTRSTIWSRLTFSSRSWPTSSSTTFMSSCSSSWCVPPSAPRPPPGPPAPPPPISFTFAPRRVSERSTSLTCAPCFRASTDCSSTRTDTSCSRSSRRPTPSATLGSWASTFASSAASRVAWDSACASSAWMSVRSERPDFLLKLSPSGVSSAERRARCAASIA